MSAFINAANERLTATVSSGPLETEWKLVTAWLKRPSSESVGSVNIAYHLSHDGGGLGGASVWLAGGINSTPAWVGRGGNATGATAALPVAFSSDAWVLTGVLVGPNTGSGSAVLKTYVDGTTGSTTCGNTATSARQLTNLCIGSTANDVSARWRGYVAEQAVFIPTDEANADAIMAELATTTADAIASGTPVWYAPLLSDGVATIGSNATVGGTTTFDADHPTLSGGAGSPPSGTVTIGTITHDHDSASIPWTYDAADETGYEYSLDSGAWTDAGTSPLELTGLTPETEYSIEIRAVNADGEGAASTPGTWTTDAAPGDTTAPTLSSPTGSATGSTTASGSVSTDEDNGTLYAVCTTSSTAPTEAQVQAGEDHTGAAAAYTTSQAVTGTGVQNVNATGLTAEVTYYWHFQHQDAAGNDSTVSSSASFTTDAAATGATITTRRFTTDGGTVRAGETISHVMALALADPTVVVAYWADAVTEATGELILSDDALVDGADYLIASLSADGVDAGARVYTAAAA